MEFGTEGSPGKELRETPAITTDKNGSLRLEMARDHPMLVQHSKFHTQGWRANGDVSLILSKSDPNNPSVEEILAVEKYVSGYACKGNQPTGSVVELFKDIVNSSSDELSTSPKSVCTKLLMNTVKRDIPAVEAAYELSRLPLFRSSHTFQNISLSGSRVVCTNGAELTITKNTPLDRYLQRDNENQLSFYNFICKNGKVPVLTGFSHASWPLEENYCQNMLILHYPNWRKISDIKPVDSSWVGQMKSFLQTSDCPNFVKADVEKAKQKIEEQNNDIENDTNFDESHDNQPEWMELVNPCKQFEDLVDFSYDDGGPDFNWNKHSFQYPSDLGLTWLDDIKETSLKEDDKKLSIPDIDISKMNVDQKFAFDIVIKSIHNYLEHPDQFEPLRMIISGTAGSGKSFLIKCIVKAIRIIFGSNKAVQVLCPTGSSANIISGVTLHSFLKIPTTKRGKDMKAPEGSTGENLQKNCENLKVLLVDERSLIGSTTLGWMEFMCRCGVQQGNNSTSSWGGLPVVVFFGDDVQLPPVLDSPVYNSSAKSPASMHGVLVWKNFNSAVHLHQMVRQDEDQQQLKDVLLSLREYKATAAQASWLQNFQWNNLKLTHGEDLLYRMSDKGLFVFPTLEEVWTHNKAKLLELNTQHPIAKLVSECRGLHSQSADSEKAGGLQKTLFLCKSAKVMLSVNLCVPYGLFNGASGKIVDIIYLNGKRPESALPDVIVVEFETYKGPSFIEENSKVVPIFPVDRKIDCHCNSCYRKQFPLRLGWATTIHKCQGMTIGKGEPFNYIVINPGTMSFESRNPGALFVALSRAKSAGSNTIDPDFAWHSTVLVNQDRICHVVKTPTVAARTKEIGRISVLCSQTKQKYSFLKFDHSFQSFLQSYLYNPTLEE